MFVHGCYSDGDGGRELHDGKAGARDVIARLPGKYRDGADTTGLGRVSVADQCSPGSDRVRLSTRLRCLETQR